ncbi:hypothetical protein D9M68_615210 [compost metagenome]
MGETVLLLQLRAERQLELGMARRECVQLGADQHAEGLRSQHAAAVGQDGFGRDLLVIAQAGHGYRTSNTPAAPMPPPMHIVTTTFLAPRRLPSMSAWPVRRWPLTP